MKSRINLLPPHDESVADRAIYFALNYLRYILVLTQIVVIGVFFYRFRADQDIIDLKEELSQRQEIVDVSRPLVKEAQAIDNQVGIVKEVVDEQDIFIASLDYLLGIFPADMKLDSLIIKTNGTIEMTGRTADTVLLKRMYDTLRRDNKYKSVELSSVNRTVSGFVFIIKLNQYILPKK